MKISHISKVMSIAAPPQPSYSTTLSAMREASFIKFGAGFWNSELICIQGHPTTVYAEISVRGSKNCLEFSIA